MAERAERRRRRRLPTWAAGGAVALSLVLSGCGGSANGDDAFAGTVLTNPYVIDASPLTDTDRQPWSLAADTDAPLTLVFFGYTHCPDICGVVMGNLASAMTQLEPADRAQVEIVYVTTDPQRDTPEVLRDYLDRLDPAFVGLTGDLDTIVEIGSTVAVGVERGDPLPGGGYDVSHSTQVLGIDSDDEVPLYWPQETTSREYAADIHTLLTTG